MKRSEWFADILIFLFFLGVFLITLFHPPVFPIGSAWADPGLAVDFQDDAAIVKRYQVDSGWHARGVQPER